MDRTLENQKPSRRSDRMRSIALVLSFIAGTFSLVTSADAVVKKVPYPEVKVKITEAYKPDAAFEAMIASFAAAAVKKDPQALFALVGPTFVWTLAGTLSDEFDSGRDALHNFKVVFGFRPPGADADAAVENGPFWDALAAFAADKTYYKASDSGNLICGPMGADVADEDILEQARNKVATHGDQVDWYFTLGDTPVAKRPGDRGLPIAKADKLALPVLSKFPLGKEGEPEPEPTFLEVLLPSGKTGWIPVSAARPLAAERLCYAKTVAGEWKIVGYDQTE
jgi:hypothetical protein